MLNYRETEILNNLIKGKKYNFKLISEKYGVSDRGRPDIILITSTAFYGYLTTKLLKRLKIAFLLTLIRILKIYLRFWKKFINYLWKIG